VPDKLAFKAWLNAGAAVLITASFTLPVGSSWIDQLLEGLSIPLLVVATICVAMLSLWLHLESSPSSWRSLLVFVSIACFACLCCAWTPFTVPTSKTSVAEFAGFLALGLMASALTKPAVNLRIFTTFSTCQAVVCLFQGVAQVGGMHSADLFRVGGTFQSPVRVSLLLASAAPIAFALALHRPTKVLVMAVGLIWAGLVLTWSRAPLLGAALGSIYVVWCWQHSARGKLWAFVSTCAVVAIVGFAVIVRSSGPLRTASSTRSTMSRPIQWQGGYNLFVEHPLGVGPGNVFFDIKATVPGRGEVSTQSTNPRNELLMLLDGFGILGGFLMFMYAFGAYLTLRANRSAFSWAIGGSLVSLMFISLFDSPFFCAGERNQFGLARVPVRCIVED